MKNKSEFVNFLFNFTNTKMMRYSLDLFSFTERIISQARVDSPFSAG